MTEKLWRVLGYVFFGIIALSVCTTAYNTFITNEYEVFGVWTEFEDGIAYTEFYVEGEYYEVETESYEVDDIFQGMTEEYGEELSDNTYYATEYAVEEAYIMLEEADEDTEEESEEEEMEEDFTEEEDLSSEDEQLNIEEDLEITETEETDDSLLESNTEEN